MILSQKQQDVLVLIQQATKLTLPLKETIVDANLYIYLRYEDDDSYKATNSSIDFSSLEQTSDGKIDWRKSDTNIGRFCNYSTTLVNKESSIEVTGKVQIVAIVNKESRNPTLILQDEATNIMSWVQTCNFKNCIDSSVELITGCRVAEKKLKQHIHVPLPSIVNNINSDNKYPTLYMLTSETYVYVGITYKGFVTRLEQHATLKDDKELSKVRTFDILCDNEAKAYCIGKFTDYTCEELYAMTKDKRQQFFHNKMEQVETVFITLASQMFSDKKILVNKKQIIAKEELQPKVLDLKDIGFEIDWDVIDEIKEFEPFYSEEEKKAINWINDNLLRSKLSKHFLNTCEEAKVPIKLFLNNIVNNLKKEERSLGRKITDEYNHPTSMPTGNRNNRFDGYFGYKYNPNPKCNKSKPYWKKTEYGYINKSVKDMKRMVSAYIEEQSEKKRLYLAYTEGGYIFIETYSSGEFDSRTRKRLFKSGYIPELDDNIYI
ncbi:hypothetical protein [Turicibacter sanguinis]|uniref:hypothetical protein n=1 Tax=Turicibacter sanguinis TaxID=154288 RepID=UPI00189BEF13|nr:hypothetical protein [Turicibacter sanguinis]